MYSETKLRWTHPVISIPKVLLIKQKKNWGTQSKKQLSSMVTQWGLNQKHTSQSIINLSLIKLILSQLLKLQRETKQMLHQTDLTKLKTTTNHLFQASQIRNLLVDQLVGMGMLNARKRPLQFKACLTNTKPNTSSSKKL